MSRVSREKTREKFGGKYQASERLYTLGIDIRFTEHLAGRMKGKTVLETCTGGGFSTISLAKYARAVYTVEIDRKTLATAKKNVAIAGRTGNVTFIPGDIMNPKTIARIPDIDAAYLDPDWAVSGADHQYRFINSSTRPPSDLLLELIFTRTPNVTLIQPPCIPRAEFIHLPPHEGESLYLSGVLELYCLHFGRLARQIGPTEFRV